MYHTRFRPYEGDGDYIFISYSHRNSDTILPVIDYLHDIGYKVWFDEGIEADAEWPAYIEDHLNRSAAVLAFISSDFVSSSNCRKEVTYALNKGKPFIYVMIEETPLSNGLDLQLADQQCIYATRMAPERFYEKLAQTGALERCRWKNPDGTMIAQPAVRLKRSSRKKTPKEKKDRPLIVRILRLIGIGVLAIIIFFGILVGCEVVKQMRDGTGNDQPTEVQHSWEQAADGVQFCTTCGVQTGRIPGESHKLLGFWASSKVSLNGSDAGIFVPQSVVTECYSLSLDLQITNYSGDPFGDYDLYIRTQDNTWQKVGSFPLTKEAADSQQSFTFDFSQPVTFTGLSIVLHEQTSDYNMDYNLEYHDVLVKQ